jgi:HAD superfamily hydrolase (TIGR01509 family)
MTRLDVNATTHGAHSTDISGSFDVVVFDHDGVLVDSEILAMELLADMASAHGVPTTVTQAIDTFLGTSIDHVLDYIRAQGGVVDDEYFVDTFHEDLFTAFRERLQPVPGMKELLVALHSHSLISVVASSGTSERVDLGLTCSGLSPYFDSSRITTRDHVSRGKPAPDIFLAAAVKAATDPARCIVIEDSPHGITAAHRAGMRVIGLAHRTPTARLEEADWVVESSETIRELLLGPTRTVDPELR